MEKVKKIFKEGIKNTNREEGIMEREREREREGGCGRDMGTLL